MSRDYVFVMGMKDEGPQDRAVDATVVDLLDMSGIVGHGVGPFLEGLRNLNVVPIEIGIDLLVLASAVYAADTSYNRKKTDYDSWTRQFSLSIPVSNVERWTDLADHLSSTLRFLTGDYWNLCFRARPADKSVLAKPPEELDLTAFDCVSLFSGGLDSLIGAIDLLASGKRPLLISHYWDAQASAAQKRLSESLSKKFGEDSYGWLRAHIGFSRADLATAGEDDNQRARSFLFYSMAAVAADALATTETVIIPENGLIALNVPLEPFRLGSLSTRTAHPHFIKSYESFVRQLGIKISLTNPYGFKTKGEMVKECADGEFLKSIVADSMSCSAPDKLRWQKAKPQHCGFCVPCLIRRASLLSGLSGKDPTLYYLDDLRAEELESMHAEGRNISSFKFAVADAATRPKSLKYIVQKPGPLEPDLIDNYAGIYGRGMAEVGKLLRGVVARHG